MKATLEHRIDDLRRHIRPFQDEDEVTTAAVWHRAGLAAYPYLPTWQVLTLEHAQGLSRRYPGQLCNLGWHAR